MSLTLKERFGSRLMELLAHAQHLADGDPVGALSWLGKHWGTDVHRWAQPDFVDAMASFVERTVNRYTSSLIADPTLRVTLLDDAELVARWPLPTGAWPVGYGASRRSLEAWKKRRPDSRMTIDSAIREHGKTEDALLAALGDIESALCVLGGISDIFWPPEVAPERAAELLDRVDEAEAKATAVAIRKSGADSVVVDARWNPVAVAIIALAEQRALATPETLAREALRRLRSNYGRDLHFIVRSALQAIKGEHFDDSTRETLLAETQLAVEAFAETLSDIDDADGAALLVRDLPSGLSRLDARFLDFLSERYGEEGRKAAAASREKWKQDGDSPVLALRRWEPNAAKPRIRLLATVLWHARVRVICERGHIDGITLRTVRVTGGDEYAKVPKFVAPISWAFGAPGHQVEVDGNTYTKAPGVALAVAAPSAMTKVVPRTYAILPPDYTMPHQASLPLGHPSTDDEPSILPVAITTATHYAMPTVAAKIALMTLASSDIRAGRLARISLGDLARLVHAGMGRIQQPQIKSTAEALTLLRGLLAYLPDDTTIQIFDVKVPAHADRARPDMDILLGLSRTSMAILGQEQATSLGRSYRGEFLFNVTGAMKLPNKRPALLRHLVRASAHWNAAFDPKTGQFQKFHLQSYTAREWAILTNTLPPAAVEYVRSLKTKTASTKSQAAELSKATKEVSEQLGELDEEHGLVAIERDKDGSFKVLPPPAWQEAWSQMRSTGGR